MPEKEQHKSGLETIGRPEIFLRMLLNYSEKGLVKRGNPGILVNIFKRCRIEGREAGTPVAFSIAELLSKQEENEEINKDAKILILVACLRVIYEALHADISKLHQTEATLAQEHRPAKKCFRHIQELLALHKASRLKKMHEKGIYAPEQYDWKDLISFIDKEDPSDLCDLLLHFPRPAYTSGAASYVERIEREESEQDDELQIPTLPNPGPRGLLRVGRHLPLVLVEGREPEEIVEKMRGYRDRVRHFIIVGHGSEDHVSVIADKGESESIGHHNLEAPWVQSLWNCLAAKDPQACTILHSCETGFPGGIAEGIRTASRRPVWAPEGLVNGTTIGSKGRKTNCQFWLTNSQGVIVPVGTRFIA